MELIKIQADSLSIGAVADAFAKMEEQNARVAVILMNPIMFANFKECSMEEGPIASIAPDWAIDADGSPFLRDGTEAGFFWGALIKIDLKLPENIMIFNSEELFTVQPVELLIKQPLKRNLLWSVVRGEQD